MKKNILMIAYTYYSIDARVMKEAETCVKNGYNVDFITLSEPHIYKNQLINGVNVYRVKQEQYRGKSLVFYFISYFEFFIRCFLKTTFLYMRKKYTFVHVNNMPDFLVFCALIPKLLGAKVLLDIHDPMSRIFLNKYKIDADSLLYKLILIEEKICAIFADHILTVHEPIKNDVLVNEGLPKEKISIVSNFAEESIFKLVENYSINKPLMLIFHGTIAARFGFDMIVDVFSKLKPVSDTIHLTIIGRGDYEDQLKKLIKENNLEGIINFENRFYNVSDLPGVLKDYHLGLVSYQLSEATSYMLPVKMLELWLMGIPVITVQNKAIKYYFKEDEYFYYDPGNSATLVNLLQRLIDNPDLLMEKRSAILKRRDLYSWKAESRKYINVVNKLCNWREYGKN